MLAIDAQLLLPNAQAVVVILPTHLRQIAESHHHHTLVAALRQLPHVIVDSDVAFGLANGSLESMYYNNTNPRLAFEVTAIRSSPSTTPTLASKK